MTDSRGLPRWLPEPLIGKRRDPYAVANTFSVRLSPREVETLRGRALDEGLQLTVWARRTLLVAARSRRPARRRLPAFWPVPLQEVLGLATTGAA